MSPSEPPQQIPPDDEDERLRVRLALAASRVETSAVEVSTEQMLALRDNRLTGEEREHVLSALDANPEAYEDWLALNRFLDGEHAADRRPRILPVWARSRLAVGGASAAAVAALVVALVLLVRVPAVSTLVQAELEQAISAGLVTAGEQMGQLPAYDESASDSYGFGPADVGTGSRQALASGIWAAREWLAGQRTSPYLDDLLLAGTSGANIAENPWRDTEWEAYTTLGRWLVLIAAVCAGPDPGRAEFWKKQPHIARTLARAIPSAGNGSHVTEATQRHLAVIADQLSALSAGAAAGRPCGAIQREARQLATLALSGRP